MDKIHTRAVRATVAIVLIAFAVELVVMLLLRSRGTVNSSILSILLDATLLAILLAAPIYWLVLAPLEREHDKRLQAEQLANSYERLATTDSLTGTLNRRGILDRLQEAIADASRYDRPLSIAIVDLDHFKEINDHNGHASGDLVLCHTAALVAQGLRTPDKAGRLGGDEFLLILPQTSLEATVSLAERLRASIGTSPLPAVPREISVTVSIGITEWVLNESLGQLLSRCDKALYQAKNSGRDRVVSLPGRLLVPRTYQKTV